MLKIAVLDPIRLTANRIGYRVDVPAPLKSVFNGSLWVEYDVDLSGVPDSVLILPLLSVLAPVAWLYGAELSVNEVDEEYWNFLHEWKQLLQGFYPEQGWQGTLRAGSLQRGPVVCKDRSSGAVLFSGGLDSVTTYLRHEDEGLALVSIRGFDISLRYSQAWDSIRAATQSFARSQGRPWFGIATNVREWLDEDWLSAVAGRSWWLNVAHAVISASLGLPLAYAQGWSHIYQASGVPTEFAGRAGWGGHPAVVGAIRDQVTVLLQDGGECKRQDKVRYFVQRMQDAEPKIRLRVCWKAKDGGNCCRCEKCCRTMLALYIEGLDPRECGFENTDGFFAFVRRQLEGGGWEIDFVEEAFWQEFKLSVSARQSLRVGPDRDFFVWFDSISMEELKRRTDRNPALMIKRWVGRSPLKLQWFLRKLRKRVLAL